MKKFILSVNILAFIFGAFVSTNIEAAQAFTPETYLKNKIETTDPRYPTMVKTIDLISKRNLSNLVEVKVTVDNALDTSNNYEATLVFANWSHLNSGQLYIAAFDKKAAQILKAEVQPYNRDVTIITDDFQTYLKNFDGKIDFLYLDTAGFNPKKPEKFNERLLKVTQAISKKLNKNGVVLFGALPTNPKKNEAVKFLLDKGWKIVKYDYQTVLTK